MKRIIILFLFVCVGLLVGVLTTNAATCEEKYICIDDKNIGYQDSDCKITSADDILNSFPGNSTPNASFICVIGCKDGECIDDGKPSTCSDSDGGQEYFIKGTVALHWDGSITTASDYCDDNTTLQEQFCGKSFEGEEMVIENNTYKCPNGCANGACLKTGNTSNDTGSVCVDSDGGKDIFKPGIITIDNKKQNWDSCGFEPQTINEKFCLSDGTYGSEEMQCPGLCESGVGADYCSNNCTNSGGYYCSSALREPDSNVISISFLNKDCTWSKFTPCQSNRCTNGLCSTNSDLIDTDGDGLLDIWEVKWGTDPNKFDTDGDGYGDMTEIYAGYDPLGNGKLTESQLALREEMYNETVNFFDSSFTTSTEDLAIEETTSSDEFLSGNLLADSDATSAVVSNLINEDDFAKITYLILGIFWLFILIIYIFSAYCLQLIAKKLSVVNAWLAWIPVANVFLIIKCADKSYWWFLLFLIPLVNIIAMIILWFNICQKLSKPGWLALLMLFFPINLIVMGYLAFSSSDQQVDYPVDNYPANNLN